MSNKLKANPLDAEEVKTATELGAYVESFIANRFPGGLPPAMYTIVAEMVVDALYDGMRLNEKMAKESCIITEF